MATKKRKTPGAVADDQVRGVLENLVRRNQRVMQLTLINRRNTATEQRQLAEARRSSGWPAACWTGWTCWRRPAWRRTRRRRPSSTNITRRCPDG
jgi:hypothetical protein